jgi:hypothetical protein
VTLTSDQGPHTVVDGLGYKSKTQREYKEPYKVGMTRYDEYLKVNLILARTKAFKLPDLVVQIVVQ